MIYLVKLFQHEKLLKHTNLVVARNQKKVYNQMTHGVNKPIKCLALN